jgi:hypothetical protein
MNKALDEIRASESHRMAPEGYIPVLKKSRWLLLKREKNLKTAQRFRLVIDPQITYVFGPAKLTLPLCG